MDVRDSVLGVDRNRCGEPETARLPQQLPRLKLETGRRSPQRPPPPGLLGFALGAGAGGGEGVGPFVHSHPIPP